MMSDAGYTTGIFGKWQLQSYDPPDFPGADKRRGIGMHPKDAGFDEYALFHALDTEDKGSRYTHPTMLEGKAGEQGTLKTYHGSYGADIWVSKILDFVDRRTQQPRFVYYPMALPHWPFQPTPNSQGYDADAEQPTDLKYAGDMIEYMDTAVGKLMDGLKQRGLAENTIVIFYSDNGTHLDVSSKFTAGRMIDGGKATPRQTGIHVPLIIHCPARFKPQVVDGIVDASDFYPTLMKLAGLDPNKNAPDHDLDGISFVSQLTGKKGPRRDAAFFWYDPRPGWDKERFHRHVFAINRTHKLFRDGRLFRLSELPLEESLVPPEQMTAADREAATRLQKVIQDELAGVGEPPLLDAFGNPLADPD
jgi:arylsulfatase A-like enzyme